MTVSTTGPAVRIAAPRIDLEAMMRDNIAWLSAHTGQIVIASVIAGVVVAILLGAKWLGRRLRKTYWEHNHWRRITGSALSKIRLWFVAAVGIQIIANYSHAPEDLAKTIYFLFVIATTLQAAIFAREIILGLIEHRAKSDDGQVALASAMGIIRLLVTFALFAIAAVLILSNLGVNVTGLIAGLGVGGIAIGLAAQGIFADLFAALAIIFDRPFRKGDSIKYDQTSGSVEDIGLKSTRIRALTGEQVIIANKQLLEKEIHNLARLDRRRTVMTLGLVYSTPIAVLDTLPQTIRDVVEGCENCRLVRCGLMTFNQSSLDVEVQYDVNSENYEVVFKARHQVNIAILRRFAELGIQFAYPTQTSFTAAPDGSRIMPYASAVDPERHVPPAA